MLLGCRRRLPDMAKTDNKRSSARMCRSAVFAPSFPLPFRGPEVDCRNVRCDHYLLLILLDLSKMEGVYLGYYVYFAQ